MAIEWSKVKAVRIPEGDCKRVTINGTIVWEKGLPSEYQQVEYIESTGTQYITTDYTPTITENMKIEIGYMFTRIQAGESFLFGSRLNASNIPTFQCEYYSNKWWYCGSGIWQFRNIFRGIGADLNTRYSLVMDENVIAINNFTNAPTETRQNGKAVPIYIFAGNWYGQTRYINKGARIYCLTFTADGVKEAEFVPCYRKSDGEIGMYDLVNGVFYTNSGSGTFIKGEDV